jgi:hypothetical protein
MIMFCLTVHHLWGRTLAKHNQDACTVVYTDDGYIKDNLSVELEVLSDIKQVLKEDDGLALNDKTNILIKGLGVPICTDAFIQHFVKDKCQAIMEDVDKLDNIQDGFIHYQLLCFCQATLLQYLNCHVQLANQNVLHISTSTTALDLHC